MSHKNLLQLFEASAKTYQDLDCYVVRQGEQWVCWSWTEVRQKVMALSAGLQGLGVVQGDRVSILSSTRAEWSLCDLAILSLGAITVPVYHSNIPEEVEFILVNSEAKGVFVENAEQLAKVQQAIDRLPQLQFIVMMEGGEGKSGTLQMDRLLKTNLSKATAYSQNLEVMDEETTASFVYTSGTTGQPKGSILTHGNFLAEIDACMDVLRVDPQDVSLSFLPLAHILARVIQFYQIATGFTNAYAESIEKLAENIQEIRPNFLLLGLAIG